MRYSSLTSSFTRWSLLVSWFIITHLLKQTEKMESLMLDCEHQILKKGKIGKMKNQPGSPTNNSTSSIILHDPVTSGTDLSILLAPCFYLNNITPRRDQTKLSHNREKKGFWDKFTRLGIGRFLCAYAL